MAQVGYTPILTYASVTTGALPAAGNLSLGELAINIADGKLFYKDPGGAVQTIATGGTSVIGGSTTQVQYNNAGVLAGSANFTFNGTTATINTLNLTNALDEAYGGTGNSTYAVGDLLYSPTVNNLGKLSIGTNGYILTSTGSVPQWSAPSAVSVATATNLAGGATGSLPVQSGAGVTGFLAIGTNGQVLTSDGTTAQWTTLSSGMASISFGTTGLTPATATGGAVTVAGTLNIANGGTGQGTAQLAINALAGAVVNGQYLRGNGTNVIMSAIQAADVPTLNQSTTGSAASLSISGQTGLLTFTGLASTSRAKTVRDAPDTILELGGTYTPTGTWNWTSATATWPTFNQSTTGSAATVSIAGQTGLLSFTGLASTNRAKTVRDAPDTILELGGSYTPTGTWNWASATATWPTFNQSTSGNALTATTATNIAGGAANRIAYNTNAGATGFVVAPTVASTFLQWNGSAFVWASASGGSAYFDLVSSTTLSSAVSFVDCSANTTTYKGIIVYLDNFLAFSGPASLRVQLLNTSGAVISTGLMEFTHMTSGITTISSSITAPPLDLTIQASSGSGLTGQFNITFNSSLQAPAITYAISSVYNSNAYSGVITDNSGTQIGGIRLSWSTGNVAAGSKIWIYGVKA